MVFHERCRQYSLAFSSQVWPSTLLSPASPGQAQPEHACKAEEGTLDEEVRNGGGRGHFGELMKRRPLGTFRGADEKETVVAVDALRAGGDTFEQHGARADMRNHQGHTPDEVAYHNSKE